MIDRNITTRRTPNGRHLYRATQKGQGSYGWGNTPTEARAKLAQQIAAANAEREALAIRREAASRRIVCKGCGADSPMGAPACVMCGRSLA
jgi:ribosomal protein L40E